MSLAIILRKSALLQRRFLVLLLTANLLFSVQNKSFVHSARSQSSSSSSSSSESTGGTGSSSVANSNRERERELISAQFRAAVQDGRDLDTGDTPAGIDLQAAAAAQLAAAGLTEEEAQLMPKYMAASATAYAPSKLRLNRYSQTGFYDPYPSYVAAFSNVPSTYYPYNAYSGYRENPMLDTYPYYEKDRLRELQMRAMQPQSAAASSYTPASSSSSSSSNRDGFGSNFYNGPGGNGFREGFRSADNEQAAAGHGGDEGHGWSHSHVNHYTSKVNTNAIGLLGLLGLLSLLSNVLLQFTTTTTTTTTAAAGRRKKRSTEADEEDHERKRERIFMEILPHLTPVAHAKDGTLPLECTFHGVCMANKVLVKELGAHGRPAGARISSAIVKLLDKVTPGSSNSKGKTSNKSELKKKLESAGLHGRDKKNCEKSYPICSALRQQETPNLPFVIRMQDLPQLISKVSKLSQGNWGGGGGGVPMNL